LLCFRCSAHSHVSKESRPLIISPNTSTKNDTADINAATEADTGFDYFSQFCGWAICDGFDYDGNWYKLTLFDDLPSCLEDSSRRNFRCAKNSIYKMGLKHNFSQVVIELMFSELNAYIFHFQSPRFEHGDDGVVTKIAATSWPSDIPRGITPHTLALFKKDISNRAVNHQGPVRDESIPNDLAIFDELPIEYIEASTKRDFKWVRKSMYRMGADHGIRRTSIDLLFEEIDNYVYHCGQRKDNNI